MKKIRSIKIFILMLKASDSRFLLKISSRLNLLNLNLNKYVVFGVFFSLLDLTKQ